MRVHAGAAGPIAALMVLAATECCPVPPGGPTATGVTNTMSLAPGDMRHVDVDVPESTTQLNLEFDFETPNARLRVRQIEPDCTPEPGDACPARRDSIITPPAGVRRIGSSGVATPGARTRIVLENVSDVPINLMLTVVPWRAGCT
jgi:hypothetical protein